MFKSEVLLHCHTNVHQIATFLHHQLSDVVKATELCENIFLYVTGSGKRYTMAHTMIFLYKCCCSKTRNIFYSLKKKFFWLRYLQLFAYTHAKFEELNVLLTGQARCLKTAT